MTETHRSSDCSRAWRRPVRDLLLAIACAGAAAWTASAAEPPPPGYGKATFRMSFDEVHKLYPEARVVRAPAEARQSSSRIPQIDELVLSGQSVLGLTDCEVRLRFAADQLWFANVNCGRDQPVREKLIEVYGEPQEIAGHDYWLADEYAVSLNRAAAVFGFMDLKLDRLIQAAMLQAVTEAGQTR